MTQESHVQSVNERGPPSHPPLCLCLTPAAIGGQRDGCPLLGVTQHLDGTARTGTHTHTHAGDDLGRQEGEQQEAGFLET